MLRYPGQELGGLVAEQRDGRSGSAAGSRRGWVTTMRPGLSSTVEHAHEAASDVLQAQLAGAGGGGPATEEQVVALIKGQVEGRGRWLAQHLLRRAACRAALDAAE